MPYITDAAPHHQQHDAERREQIREQVDTRPTEVEMHIGGRGHHHHHVRSDAVRTFGAGDRPVREVTDLHQHGHPHLVDREPQILLAELHVADGDRVERYGRDGLGRLHDVDPVVLAAVHIGQHVDALPGCWSVVGRHGDPFVAVLEPTRAQFEIAFALVAVAPVHHNRLNGERLDDVAARHGVDVPRPDGAHLGEFGLGVGLGAGGLGEHHHVLHAERLQVRHTLGRVVVVVSQLTYRVRALLAHRSGRDEVVRRGSRGLEEQAFHAGDAAVGPVRQQHQRHGGAVLAGLAVVLPQRAAAAVLRVGSELAHGGDQRPVLAVRRLALVAGEVVAGPRVAERVGGGGSERDGAPLIHRLAVVGLIAGPRHDAEEEQLDHEHPERHNAGGDSAHDHRGALRQLAHTLHTAGDEQRRLDDAHHHQQIPQQIEERQQPRVPQQTDERQAVAGEIHQCDERQAADAEPCTVQTAPHDRRHEADDGETGDEDVEERREREEHVPERIVGALGPVAVLHVGHVGVVQQERQHPERRQQQHGDTRRDAVAHARAVDPHQAQQDGTEGDEDEHDAVRQTGQRQHDGRPGAVLAGLEATRQQTEAEDAERQRDGERELAGHRALHVAAVDRERLVEQEQQAAEGEQFGERIAEPGETSEGETAQRQGDDADDHDDLERDAVGQHHVQRHDHQRRDDHVEAVHR